jgi:hypothetical protein
MSKKKRWRMVLLRFLAGMVNYPDRFAPSVSAPVVTQDWGLTPGELAPILSNVFVGGWASGKRVLPFPIASWRTIARWQRSQSLSRRCS